MAVPDFQSMMLPFLQTLEDGQPHSFQEVAARIAKVLELTEQDEAELLQSGSSRFLNRVGWTRTYLKKAELIEAIGRGRFKISEQGKKVLATKPINLDAKSLERLRPGMWGPRKATRGEDPATFEGAARQWVQRPGVEERLRAKLELEIPDDALRIKTLLFFAMAIENADEERSSAWFVRETEHGLRLNAGRLLACETHRGNIHVSVIGPVSDEVRTALGAEAEEDSEFKAIPGGVLIRFPADRADQAIRLLQTPLNNFVDEWASPGSPDTKLSFS